VVKLRRDCVPVTVFGGKRRNRGGGGSMDMDVKDSAYFQTPCMPYVPLFGIIVNWYLVAQLEIRGLVSLVGFLVAISVFYFGRKRERYFLVISSEIFCNCKGRWIMNYNHHRSTVYSFSTPLAPPVDRWNAVDRFGEVRSQNGNMVSPKGTSKIAASFLQIGYTN